MARRIKGLNQLLGITKVKRQLSRDLGIPLTKSGRKRKLKRMIKAETGCSVFLVLLLVVSLLTFSPAFAEFDESTIFFSSGRNEFGSGDLYPGYNGHTLAKHYNENDLSEFYSPPFLEEISPLSKLYRTYKRTSEAKYMDRPCLLLETLYFMEAEDGCIQLVRFDIVLRFVSNEKIFPLILRGLNVWGGDVNVTHESEYSMALGERLGVFSFLFMQNSSNQFDSGKYYYSLNASTQEYTEFFNDHFDEINYLTNAFGSYQVLWAVLNNMGINNIKYYLDENNYELISIYENGNQTFETWQSIWPEGFGKSGPVEVQIKLKKTKIQDTEAILLTLVVDGNNFSNFLD